MTASFVRRALVSLLIAGCGAPLPPIADRVAGVRAPRSAPCDPLDETRCMLPWPSNVYTVSDPSTPTGLRVSVALRSLPVRDNPASLNRADGFSVASPLAAGFPRPVDHRLHGQKQTSAVRLLLAQPGREHRGEAVPLRLAVVNDTGESTASLLLAYPQRPMEYEADYLAVVLDEVTADDGTPFEAPALVKVALGLVAPASDDERALAAYHAPSRALLAEAGIDASHVLRLWDFTTRSAASVRQPLDVMRAAALAAADAGSLTVNVQTATLLQAGAIDVRGEVSGLPAFLEPDGGLALGADGLPRRTGVHVAPFRAVLPAGSGTYPMVVYGHGTGGTINDDTFDEEIVAAGAGKLNLQWDGWTESTTIKTLLSYERVFTGTDRSTGLLLQSLGDAAGLQASLAGALGDALAAPVLAGVSNPAGGRRPDVSKLVYAGGSLGGTMGYVLSQSEPNIHYAALNVPGAAWTHFAPESELWSTLEVAFSVSTPSEVSRALGMSMTQTNWDPVDGAAWAPLSDRSDLLLLEQESIGDPILPNIGSELLAASSKAVQLGAVLEPIAGVSRVEGPVTRSAITQFRVPASETGLAIHGFAARGSPAGVAARQQISAFITSVWAGTPRISVPEACAVRVDQSCDFLLNP